MCCAELCQPRPRARDDGAWARQRTSRCNADYAAAFYTPIVALTGTRGEIDNVTRAFHVFVRPAPQRRGPHPIEHSGTPCLIGEDGAYRALLRGDPASDATRLRAASRS